MFMCVCVCDRLPTRTDAHDAALLCRRDRADPPRSAERCRCTVSFRFVYSVSETHEYSIGFRTVAEPFR